MSYATGDDLNAVAQSTFDVSTAQVLLDMAGGSIDRVAGRSLASAQRTETLPGRHSVTLWLDWPITAVASVTQDGTLLTVDVDFTWDRSGWLTRIDGKWDSETVVVYTCGFDPDSPEMLTAKRIELEVAARAAANPQLLDAITIDGVTASFAVREGNLIPAFALTESQKVEIRQLRSRRRQG